MAKKKNKKISYSKVIVAAVIVMNIIFTAATLAVFWHTSSEPGVLVAAFFAFSTGELWALAGIKKTKIKKDSDESEE